MTHNTDPTASLTASGDIAYMWDLHTDSIVWHGIWRKVFGGETAPSNSQALYQVLHSDDRHIVFNGESRTIDRQFRITPASGGVLWVHERGASEMQGQTPIRQRGVWRIIDPPTIAVAASDSQSRDHLTGCFKRRILQSYLIKAIESAVIAERVGAYLVVSIDKMSFVNEAVGTEGGDSVLRAVAARLGQIIPTRAILGRVSGDVFGVLLPEPMGNDLQSLAERIIQDFRFSPVIAANAPMHINVSVGGVRFPTVAKSANEVMIFAEQALHMVRQNGRNGFIEYVDSPERAQENRLLLELGERIKRAFKNDGFRLAYQPIVAADTETPVCYEALVRMFDDKGNPISAALFVPMIEQLGLAVELDRTVLNMAIRDMEALPWFSVAVNISGFTASQADWPAYLNKILEPRPDVARRLIVEITETAVLADINETQRFITALRALGGHVALDDFGAGSTSIRYLRELDLSFMKIDKDLLRDLLNNKEQQHIVRILIELAHGLNIQTIVEGVEEPEIADWMRQARIDFMQGYYFGRPSLELPRPTEFDRVAPVPLLTPKVEPTSQANDMVAPVPILVPHEDHGMA